MTDTFAALREMIAAVAGHAIVPNHIEAKIGRQARNDLPRLLADYDRMREALEQARRAIGDHIAPEHCYATGPLTGDDYLDFIQCPACAFIAVYDGIPARAALTEKSDG